MKCHEFYVFLQQNLPPPLVVAPGVGSASAASSRETWAVGSPWAIQASPEADVLICAGSHEEKHLKISF